MDRRIRLLVNPSAGGGRAAAVLPDVEAALARHGLGFATEPTTDLAHARRLADDAANGAPSRWGHLVYAYAALRALVGWKPARFDLDLDGERHTFTGYSVACANSKAYGGGMFVAPDAEIGDGLLDVVVTEHLPKRRF